MDHDWKLKTLRIADVRERPDLQMRVGGVDRRHVKQLTGAVDGGAVLPLIDVARIGDMLCVVDGFHRLEVARRSGAESIRARVAPMTLREALAVARLANAEHDWGKKRTRADMQNVWNSYIANGEHLDAHGVTKGAGAIIKELGCYSRETVRTRLNKAGIPLNNDADYPHGYKPYRGSNDGDDGEDIDDLATGGVGPLDAEYGLEVRAHIEAVESLYFGLGERGQGETLGAVRELLGRLEANVAPVACEPPKPVLMDI